jgi:CHAT domain-containing protein
MLLFSQHITDEQELELRNQANQAYNDRSFDKALNLFGELYQKRIEKYGENSVPVANVMTNLGVVKSQLGLSDEAIAYYEKSIPIFESSEDERAKKSLASAYQNLGIYYSGKGDIEQARIYYENADRIFQKLKLAYRNEYEALLINMAYFFLDNKNIPEAERYNKKSFEINPNSVLNYNKLTCKGLIHLNKKEYTNSIHCLQKAIQTGERDLGVNNSDIGLIYMNLGMVYLEMGDFTQSLANYQIAKDRIENSLGRQNISYSSCLKDIGLNYLRKKENESNLGAFLNQRKQNIETSLDYFQDAIIAITPGFTSKEWDSNPAPENAIDKTRLLDVLKDKAEALYLLSQVEEKKENRKAYQARLKLSLATYDLSIKTIQLIRNSYQNQESRLFLAENEHAVYPKALETAVRLYELTGERQYFEKSFEISERSRSANFQAMLRELRAKKSSGLPDSLLQKETALKGEIAAYENFIFNEKSASKPDQTKINQWKDKVFVLTQSYQQMIRFIENNYASYYQYKYADPVVPLQKIQQSLNRRDAFIEYFINEGEAGNSGEIYIFVITDNEYKILRKPLIREFNAVIDQFLKFIRNSQVLGTRKADYIQFTNNASDLYKLLIEPVVPAMQDYRLVIAPDGILSYLPFDALLASPADVSKMDFGKLDYLLHHHAISYTYSATLLYYYFQTNTRYSSKIGAFAPDYSDRPGLPGSENERFLPLPGAETEVKAVTKIISGDQFLKSDATKQTFLQNAGKYDILHLAMHTMLNDTLPLYSKMVFSEDDSQKDARALNTYEIYNLQLHADMVVLSGCNTGSGKLQKGEGVMSLARGFLFAGCPAIIMTLWNVEDISSSSIMVEFYKNLKNGYSKDEALRRAKIAYISKADPLKAHPHFWLGYVSIGRQTPLFKTKAGYFVSLIIFVFLAIVLEKWYFKRKKRISQLK